VHDPIALAVPIFFVLIGIELVWARLKGVRVYRLADAITDLSCGITSQITLLLWAALQLAIYAWMYEHWRVVTFERAWVPWVVAFFAVDFAYYWWHRLSHEVNFLWAAHVVHHQSEDYNLAVALRQSVLTSWTALPFYLPLALLGVPTLVFATVHALSTLYQFWIHTELVGKVRGPVDWILNLPSHHRVHHAINTEYLDKNYAATLIVWDRLFGTYAEEIEKPVFGITKQLGSFDPMWAQIHYWFDMGAMARASKQPIDKLRVWFASPAWKPQGYVVAPVGDLAARAKYDPRPSRGVVFWVLVNYALVVVATFAVMMWHKAIPQVPLVLASLAILGALVAFGGLVEGKRWARVAELVRIALGVAAVIALVQAR
jgi:alkylglycerol monooxygenase